MRRWPSIGCSLLDVAPEDEGALAAAAAEEVVPEKGVAAVAPWLDELFPLMAESLADVVIELLVMTELCCSFRDAEARCAGWRFMFRPALFWGSSVDEGVDTVVAGLEKPVAAGSWPSRRLFESMPLKTTSMQPVLPLLSKTRSNTFSIFLTVQK